MMGLMPKDSANATALLISRSLLANVYEKVVFALEYRPDRLRVSG